MTHRRQHTQAVAAAKAGISERSARRIENDPQLPSQKKKERHWRTRADPLELLAVYSSVSARCGNTGQADYAMANEVLNLVASAERARRGLPVYPVDGEFLAALEAGMPPAAGNALGFDRLLMLALGAERIDDVRAFLG